MRLSARRLKRIIERYYERLGEHREALNRLNVYPVPDGDTGTNMTRSSTSGITPITQVSNIPRAVNHGRSTIQDNARS